MYSQILTKLGIKERNSGACCRKWIAMSPSTSSPNHHRILSSINPANGKKIAEVIKASEYNYEKVVSMAKESFETWRMMPAPQRGEIVRQIGEELRSLKKELGALVTIETGKILSEGEGEVQEMIDICDYAVGLSRQLYGVTTHSERPLHRMYEQWHPLGIVGIVTAFNFPVAVWAWNAAIAAICGNVVVWKPSSKTPLTAIAVQNICNNVLKRYNLSGIFNLIIGDGKTIGERLITDKRVALISATGSTKMGRHVNEVVGKRFGKVLLELGGNNAIIVMNDADLDLAVRAILFGAVGTAGQRCTTTRRLLVQRGIVDELTQRLIKVYEQVTIGEPLNPNTLMGPLIDECAVKDMVNALKKAKEQGGRILYGGKLSAGLGYFVEPTIVRARKNMPIVQEETFAPILYIFDVKDLDEAIQLHNDVPQGLSSAIFTKDLMTAEKFLSHAGSDCGIANVNIGTSGAEIGLAFGGEKETGGGRESGSDSWKQYMRRQTCTINYSKESPLAQGITFGKK